MCIVNAGLTFVEKCVWQDAAEYGEPDSVEGLLV